MNQAPIDDDTHRSLGATRSNISTKSQGRTFRHPLPGVAERVARGMIARHGADAAREATIHLNRMIDRGDIAARDLWAYVVHVIHEHRR